MSKASTLVPTAVLWILGALTSSGCATVAGTAASPLTGGVDAVLSYTTAEEWYWVPFAFIGGTVCAPFVAFYNGINYDASYLDGSGGYWRGFDQHFRPYRMLRTGNVDG